MQYWNDWRSIRIFVLDDPQTDFRFFFDTIKPRGYWHLSIVEYGKDVSLLCIAPRVPVYVVQILDPYGSVY